jgi:hypothetical protein
MENKNMELNFILSKNELKKLLKRNLKYTNIHKTPLNYYSFILIILLCLIFIILFGNNIFIYLILIFLFLFKKNIIIFKDINSFISSSNPYSYIFNQTNLITTQNGIQINEEFECKTFYWNSIYGLYDIDNYIFIRTLFYDDIIIPPTAFKDKEEKFKFINIIKKEASVELLYKLPKDYTLLNM